MHVAPALEAGGGGSSGGGGGRAGGGGGGRGKGSGRAEAGGGSGLQHVSSGARRRQEDRRLRGGLRGDGGVRATADDRHLFDAHLPVRGWVKCVALVHVDAGMLAGPGREGGGRIAGALKISAACGGF